MKVNEIFYRKLFETALDALIIIDAYTGIILDVNSSVSLFFKYQKKELIEKVVWELPLFKNILRNKESFFTLSKCNLPIYIELPVPTKSEKIILAEVIISGYKINEQEILLFSFKDIYERKKTEKALRQSEKSWHSLTMNSPNHILILDLEGNVKFVNWVVPGLKKENIINKSIYNIVPSHFVNKIKASLTRVKETGKTGIYETEFVLPNGQIPWYEARVAPITENDEIVGFTVNCSDITERKEKDEELRLQSQISMNISEGVNLIKADNGLIVFTNPKFDEMFGYEPGELVGMHISIVNAPTKNKSSEKTAQEIMNSLLKNDVWEGEVCNIKKDGTIFWCFASASLFSHPKYGKVMVSVQRDITERKQIEKELQESEEKLRNIFVNSTNLFYSHTPEHVITYLSPQVEDILGYTPEEAFIKWTDLVSSNPINEKGYKLTVKAIETGKQQPPYELELVHKSGRNVMVEIREAPVVKNGKTISIVGVVTDITDRKKVEEQLNQSLSILRSTLESTADGILVVNTEGKWTSFNQKFINMWNISKDIIASGDDEKAVNSVLTQLKYPDDFKRKVKELYNHPEEKSFDIIEMKDGRIFERYSQPQYFNERIEGRVWSFREVTKQKQAEESLLESENRFKSFSEATFEAIFISENGICIAQNKMAEQMFGYTESEAIGNSGTNWIVPEDRDIVRKKMLSGYDKPYEVRALRKDGKSFYAEIRGKMMEYEGKPSRITALRDITERKTAEFELNKSHERLRELTMHMQEVIENERMKIALDLHDDLGQNLTALNLDLTWLKTRILKDSPHLSDKLNEMTDLLNVTMKNVQEIASELRPSILDNLGLISAVEWLLKEYKLKSKIKYQFNVSPKGYIIKQRLSVAIFRIIQEALTNVARHANATLVKVSILKENKLLKIIIEDNGKGITKSNIEDSKSFGLMGIKERANVFKGKVKIIGELNKGTKLIVKIPYE